MAVSNTRFVWDPDKAQANLAKHKISFVEAQSVFYDDNARLINDPDHSIDESRFLLLGYSTRARCLVVSHCYREPNDTIRLISARRATRSEEQTYRSLL